MGLRLSAISILATVALACSVSVQSFARPEPGQIVFGTGHDSTFTMVSGPANTFKQEGDFEFVGIFPHHVTGMVRMEVVKNDEPVRRAGSFTFTTPGNYWWGAWHLSDFPGPGHYLLRMTLDSESLAVGEFDLTP